MNQRPDSHEYGDYYAKYVTLVPPEGNLVSIFRSQSERVYSLLGGLSEDQANYRYAPEKWSIKQMIGHLTDNDRIMSYRLLRIARGDGTPLPGYEENDFVNGGDFDRFSIQELAEQYRMVRESTLALLGSLSEEAWSKTGTVNQSLISVRAQACVLIGHELHHLGVLEERYLK